MSLDGAVVEAAEDDEVVEDEERHRGGARNVVLCHLNARRFAFVGMERSMLLSSRLGAELLDLLALRLGASTLSFLVTVTTVG